jgi:hypothetical protein
MTTDYRAMCAELIERLEWFIAEDETNENDPGNQYWLTGKQAGIDSVARARALLASSPDQDDATLKSIREHTPRYRMSVIISTNDCCIDTRMNVIWSALNSDTEILESVSLPEKLSSYKNHELEANEV